MICTDDQIDERYGFLWLRKRKVKHPLITKGTNYRVHEKLETTYGSAIVNETYVHYLITCDNGIPQYISWEHFR